MLQCVCGQTRPILNAIVTVYTHCQASLIRFDVAVVRVTARFVDSIGNCRKGQFSFNPCNWLLHSIFEYSIRLAGAKAGKREEITTTTTKCSRTVRSVTWNDNALCVCATARLLRANAKMSRRIWGFRFDWIYVGTFQVNRMNSPRNEPIIPEKSIINAHTHTRVFIPSIRFFFVCSAIEIET